MTKVAVSKMFNDSKIQISDETNYLKVFQLTDVGMVTLRLDLENKVLKRKLRHALGISIPSVRQIEATTDALLGWMSPDELLYFCMKSEVVNRLNLVKETMTSYHSLSLDVSDARVVFSLEGGKVREVIAKLAPIDTAINSLELGEIRRTRLSQVAAAIWLTEENRATIICFRSVEKYLRDLLLISCKKGSEVGVW